MPKAVDDILRNGFGDRIVGDDDTNFGRELFVASALLTGVLLLSNRPTSAAVDGGRIVSTVLVPAIAVLPSADRGPGVASPGSRPDAMESLLVAGTG